MAGVEKRAFDSPDETRTPDKTRVDVVHLGGTTAARFAMEPGWSWSACVKPVAGTTIKILGDDGIELPSGETGRIFVAGPLLFEGYTGGGDKDRIDGLMATGDVGHFDDQGRLFIDGRDDEMIVSGGENVFPQEVEELLLAHDAVADAAVLGVPDEEFGQRLAAFVVLKPGASAGQHELQPYVRDRLARYKVPREITIVDELPRTATGKLQRGKLAPVQRS